MKEGTFSEQPPQTPVAEKPAAGEETVTREQLEEKREKLVQALEKAQGLPDSFVGKDGRTKSALIIAMREAMGALSTRMEELEGGNGRHGSDEGQVEAVEHHSKPVSSTRTRVEKAVDEAQHYVTLKSSIGTTRIPICPPPEQAARWEARPSEMFVEGGKKWTKVTYEKQSPSGFSEKLRPGDEVPFGPFRGERLTVIDNILEGRAELQGFNEVLQTLAALKEQYAELNPDAEGYDAEARGISERIAAIREGKAHTVVDLSKVRVADPEDFSQRVGEIVQTQEYLQEIDAGSNEFVPAVDPHFKLTPYYVEKLAWFSELVNRQIGLGNNSLLEELVGRNELPEWAALYAKGMTVMVGPRGSGKNKLAEHYCSVTNRPLFRYSCSPDKEERDLTYDVVLQDGEVVRIPSRVITAISTPNAVLELDEVNLLRPSVSKFLNSLLDGDRALFLNDKVIRAVPGVVIVGLMNPADYEGVENLPETIDDRSNVMAFDYPPFKRRDAATSAEIFTYDEALILKENVSALEHLSDEEFVGIWNNLFNGKSLNGPIDPEIARIVTDLKNIVAIANRTRETVKAYKTRTGDTRMERDISLRGLIEASRFYSENQLWKADLKTMPNYKAGWNAAQYAIAATYLPHTQTYRRGEGDKQALELILAEQVQ